MIRANPVICPPESEGLDLARRYREAVEAIEVATTCPAETTQFLIGIGLPGGIVPVMTPWLEARLDAIAGLFDRRFGLIRFLRRFGRPLAVGQWRYSISALDGGLREIRVRRIGQAAGGGR